MQISFAGFYFLDSVETSAQASAKRVTKSGHVFVVLPQTNMDQWLSIVRAGLEGERGAMGVRAGL